MSSLRSNSSSALSMPETQTTEVTFTSTLSLQHFHFDTFTSTLSLRHFHFNTFTSTHSLQHIHRLQYNHFYFNKFTLKYYNTIQYTRCYPRTHRDSLKLNATSESNTLVLSLYRYCTNRLWWTWFCRISFVIASAIRMGNTFSTMPKICATVWKR